MKSDKKVLIAGFMGMFFFGVAFLVIGAVLPSLSEKFGLNELESSTLVGLLPIGILIASLIFGPIIDRYGYKALMIFATITGSIGLEMLAFMEQVSVIRVGVFLIGLGGGMLNGATNALVSDASSDERKASNLSLLGFFYCLGAFLIPFLLASLSKKFDYVGIVSATGIIFFATAIYYIFIKFPSAKFKQGMPLKKIFGMAKEPILLIFSFVLFFQSGIEGLTNNWSPKFLTTFASFTETQAQYALGFIVVGMGISRIIMTFITKYLNYALIITLCMITSASGAIIITTASSVTGVIIGCILIGLGMAATFPLVLARIGEVFKEMSGTAFSFALVIAMLGNTLINLLVGQIGLSNFALLLIISMSGIVILFAIGNRKVIKLNKR